jgi:hypothetical protein
MPLAAGGGTCINGEFERPCPPGTASGQPCDPARYDRCYPSGRNGPTCVCFGFNQQWFCLGGGSPPPAQAP